MFVNSYLKTGGNFFHLLAQKVDKSIYGEMAAPGQQWKKCEFVYFFVFEYLLSKR